MCYLQTEPGVGAAAGGAAPAGMSGAVVARLQERATALTQERKRRGRTVPEGLLSHEQIRAFNTLASHPVSAYIILSFFVLIRMLLDSLHNCENRILIHPVEIEL